MVVSDGGPGWGVEGEGEVRRVVSLGAVFVSACCAQRKQARSVLWRSALAFIRCQLPFLRQSEHSCFMRLHERAAK